jgi:hypothetical protein
MDPNTTTTREIERLIRMGDASRARLSVDLLELRHRLDVPTRIRTSLREHPSRWLGGSLIAGLGASLLFRRRAAPPKVAKGKLGWVLTLAVAAARPLVKSWLADRLKQQFSASLSATRFGQFTKRAIPTSQTPSDPL